MKKTTLLLIVVTILVIGLAAARFYVTDDDFRLTNPSWNGLYGMAEAAAAKPLYSLSGLSGMGSGDTLMIVGPTTNYTPGEASQVAGFLYRGGTVVVMDDFGTAGSLLSGIGSPATINPVPMCQYESYYVNSSFPEITDISSTPYTVNVSKLVFNHPAVLNITGNAAVLASTSGDAWLDKNDNARLDTDERMGTYPVIARCGMGSGTLLVVSDSDVFINSMLDKGDNAAFLKALSGGSVLVDVSHGSPVTPLGSVYYLLKYDVLTQLAALLLLMVVCILYIGREMLIPQLAQAGQSIKNLIFLRSSVKGKDNKESDRKV